MVRFLSTDSALSPKSATLRPATLTVPEVGRISPATMLINVLLPLPDRPTMAMNSPASTVRFTWLTASNGVPRRTNWRVRSVKVSRWSGEGVSVTCGESGAVGAFG